MRQHGGGSIKNNTPLINNNFSSYIYRFVKFSEVNIYSKGCPDDKKNCNSFSKFYFKKIRTALSKS